MGIEGIIGYIGIGSNLDQPLGQCRNAVTFLSAWPGIKVLRTSSFYRSEPVGYTEQEDFVNAVCEIRTRLDHRTLFDVLKTIEERMGRREERRWGPRIIDLDLLFYGQEVIDEGDLIIPHPECHKRRFVLLPLAEIASFVIHPAFGVSVRGLLDRLEDESRVEPIFSQESLS
jgi:2-amino-4-hydroxy-6-hydroxymethyldihydropteridine diphosphokinase